MENWHSVETQKDIERLMLTTNRVGYCHMRESYASALVPTKMFSVNIYRKFSCNKVSTSRR